MFAPYNKKCTKLISLFVKLSDPKLAFMFPAT